MQQAVAGLPDDIPAQKPGDLFRHRVEVRNIQFGIHCEHGNRQTIDDKAIRQWIASLASALFKIFFFLTPIKHSH
jgi:hypothetical protein